VGAERDRDVDAEPEAGLLAVELGVDALDDAGLLEAADAVERGGGAEAGDAGELHVGAVGVLLELVEEQDVGFVKCLCHLTKEYSTKRPECGLRGPPVLLWRT
jgi:hypothetical protein